MKGFSSANIKSPDFSCLASKRGALLKAYENTLFNNNCNACGELPLEEYLFPLEYKLFIGRNNISKILELEGSFDEDLCFINRNSPSRVLMFSQKSH